MRGLLQRWTKSSIIPISKGRISLEEQKAQKQDSFLRGRPIDYLIYDYFRVTGANDSVENYADLFTISLRNDDIQEFDSKWDGILSKTKIPSDDILERLYKLRKRVWEPQDRIGIIWPGDSSEEKRTIITDWKRWWKEVSSKIYEIRILAPEMEILKENAVVKNQGTKQRVQRILGDCWQWEANGQCSKGDNCSFRHDMNKRGKSSPSNPSQNSFMQQEWAKTIEDPKSQR